MIFLYAFLTFIFLGLAPESFFCNLEAANFEWEAGINWVGKLEED